MRALADEAGAGSLFFSGTGGRGAGRGRGGRDGPLARRRRPQPRAEARHRALCPARRGGGGARGRLKWGPRTSSLPWTPSRGAWSAPARGGRPPARTYRARSRSPARRAASAVRLEDGKILPAGFAVLTSSGPARFLSDEAAMGTALFLGGPGEAGGSSCGRRGLRPLRRGARARARMGRGRLPRAAGSLRLRARQRRGGPAGRGASPRPRTGRALGRELGEAAAGWAEAALGECVSSGADFLGLGRTLAARCPEKGRRPAGGLARLAALFRQRRGQNPQHARVRRLALRGGDAMREPTRRQLQALGFVALLSPATRLLPGMAARRASHAGWLCPILALPALRARERRNIPRAAL